MRIAHISEHISHTLWNRDTIDTPAIKLFPDSDVFDTSIQCGQGNAEIRLGFVYAIVFLRLTCCRKLLQKESLYRGHSIMVMFSN